MPSKRPAATAGGTSRLHPLRAFGGAKSVVTVTIAVGSFFASTAFAGAPAGVASSPVPPPSQAAAAAPTTAAQALAAALQETTAGGEQMFCAADLARLARSHGLRHPGAAARAIQVRADNRMDPGGNGPARIAAQ